MLPKPLEDACFRDSHGAWAHFQFAGDIDRPLAVDDDTPERLPGVHAKVAANHFQSANEQIINHLQLLIVFRYFVGRELAHAQVSVRATDGVRLLTQLTEVVADFMMRNRTQPASKSVLGFFFAECLNASGHGLENFLKDVGGVGFGQMRSPTPMHYERRVEDDQLLPSLGLVTPDAFQQAQ